MAVGERQVHVRGTRELISRSTRRDRRRRQRGRGNPRQLDVPGRALAARGLLRTTGAAVAAGGGLRSSPVRATAPAPWTNAAVPHTGRLRWRRGEPASPDPGHLQPRIRGTLRLERLRRARFTGETRFPPCAPRLVDARPTR